MTVPNSTPPAPDPVGPILRADIADTVRAAYADEPPPAHVIRNEAARLREHRAGDWDETPQEAARRDRHYWTDRDED